MRKQRHAEVSDFAQNNNTRSNQIVEQGLINNVQQIGIHLATDFYLPFELISLILLVSLIGAITMARQ